MRAPTLKQTQTAFWLALKGDESALQPMMNTSRDNPSGRSSAIAVYRSNARASHVNALADIFPTCRAVLGGDYFNQLARHFINSHPSVNPDLNQYGQQFTEFVFNMAKQRRELDGFTYLADLSKLEFAIHSAYYAADATPFDPNGFQQATVHHGGAILLILQAGISLINTGYPIYDIWRSHQNNSVQSQFKALESKQYLCVHRREYQVQVTPIDQNVHQIMSGILQGQTIAQLANQFDPHSLNHGLAHIVNAAWLSGFSSR